SQLEVLAKADVFITHCGMNSAAEGLWMGVPEILFPLSGEQRAVAAAVERSGAGLRIDEKHPSPAQIKDAVFRLLQEEKWQINARRMRDEFRSCPGPSGAADFIERVYQRNH
ncbi:MAG: glucosyltransferase, partial [Solobacterium sp.]|nr:glucosyltransferase [Solobacterium sp.]